MAKYLKLRKFPMVFGQNENRVLRSISSQTVRSLGFSIFGHNGKAFKIKTFPMAFGQNEYVNRVLYVQFQVRKDFVKKAAAKIGIFDFFSDCLVYSWTSILPVM